MRGLRKSALQFGDKIRIRQRLAEFLRTARKGCRRYGDGQKIHDDADRSLVRKVWRTSRPRFPRRAGADWSSLLHELGGVETGEGKITFSQGEVSFLSSRAAQTARDLAIAVWSPDYQGVAHGRQMVYSVRFCSR